MGARRRIRPALTAVTLLAALLVDGTVAGPLAGAAERGSTPGLALHDLAGARRSLADLRGHVVVLNFWATWCAPCRAELPLLERLRDEYAGRGVRFVAASVDDASTRASIPGAVAEGGVTFDVWTGATTTDMHRFDVGSALPATAIVDADGTIAFRLLGPVAEPALRERLDWLLGTRTTASPPDRHDAFARAEHEHAEHDSHDHAHDHQHDHGHDHGDGDVAAEDASLVPS